MIFLALNNIARRLSFLSRSASSFPLALTLGLGPAFLLPLNLFFKLPLVHFPVERFPGHLSDRAATFGQQLRHVLRFWFLEPYL